MKTINFRKVLAGLVLAALCGTFFATNAVFGAPTQGPADAPYVSPTFKNVNVQETLDVKNIVTSDPGKVVIGDQTTDLLEVKGNLNMPDGAFTFNANTLTGNVTTGLEGSVKFNNVNYPGVAIKGNAYVDQLISLKNLFAVGFMITLKSMLTFQHMFALGNIYSGGEIWSKGAGTFANVNTAIIQNLNKNYNPSVSDPVVIQDDLKIVAGVADSGNTGKLIVTGEILGNSNATIGGNINAGGDVEIEGDLGVSATTRLNDLYVGGKFGSGLVNRASGRATIASSSWVSTNVSCENNHQFMTHCGYLLQQKIGANYSLDNAFLHVVDTNVIRNAGGVDTCTVQAYNSHAVESRYLTVQASCLNMSEPAAGGGGYFFPPLDWLDWGGLNYNYQWNFANQYFLDFTRLTIPEKFEEIDLYPIPDPLIPIRGNVDPVPEMDMQTGMNEMLMDNGMF